MTQEERTYISQANILETAISEFSKNGYKGTSLNHICSVGKISKGRMFHHYKDKDDIFLSAAEYAVKERLNQQKIFHFSEHDDTKKILRDFFRHKQLYFKDNPNRINFMHLVYLAPPEHLKKELHEMTEKYAEKEKAVLYDILRSLRPPIPEEYFPAAFKVFKIGSYYTHIRFFIDEQEEKDFTKTLEENAEAFDNAVQIMLYGILPR